MDYIHLTDIKLMMGLYMEKHDTFNVVNTSTTTSTLAILSASETISFTRIVFSPTVQLYAPYQRHIHLAAGVSPLSNTMLIYFNLQINTNRLNINVKNAIKRRCIFVYRCYNNNNNIQ